MARKRAVLTTCICPHLTQQISYPLHFKHLFIISILQVGKLRQVSTVSTSFTQPFIDKTRRKHPGYFISSLAPCLLIFISTCGRKGRHTIWPELMVSIFTWCSHTLPQPAEQHRACLPDCFWWERQVIRSGNLEHGLSMDLQTWYLMLH